MKFIKTQIDPWSCMPAIAMIESLKCMQGVPVAETSTTINGFQPRLENLMTTSAPNFFLLQEEIHKALNDLNIEGVIDRSWVVSYNKDGYQLPHNHCDNKQIYSGVVCLLGGKGGELCFEDRSYNLIQGDVLIFDAKEIHWTTKCCSPKIVLAFDIT